MPAGRPRLRPEQVQHGTYAGYSYHRAHATTPCPACCRARADRDIARRRSKGIAGRRRMTVSEFQAMAERRESGESWALIAAVLGFSDSYLRAIRRGTASPVPDPSASEVVA